MLDNGYDKRLAAFVCQRCHGLHQCRADARSLVCWSDHERRQHDDRVFCGVRPERGAADHDVPHQLAPHLGDERHLWDVMLGCPDRLDEVGFSLGLERDGNEFSDRRVVAGAFRSDDQAVHSAPASGPARIPATSSR